MSDAVRRHYDRYPYPFYPLLASVRPCDTYALNLTALWARFNGSLPPESARRVLVAGCGSFSPYVTALANRGCGITALDLSRRTLQRARLHCLLHGMPGVSFVPGDILDPEAAAGPFGLIDAYGVIHHLDDPSEGLASLARRLAPGGVLRLMVYSRYARRQEESIRRAFRLMGVRDAAQAQELIARARPGSRLAEFSEQSWEAGFTSGIADALLHPNVTTFRIDELLEMVGKSGLNILMFAHDGSESEVGREVERIRIMERERKSPGNFVLYLGKEPPAPAGGESMLMLNPCLSSAVSRIRFGTIRLPRRIGIEPPPLDAAARRELRPFRPGLPTREGDSIPAERRASYKRSLLLVEYRQ